MAKRICIVALLILVALGGWSSRLDAPAMSQVTAGMERALGSFAVARGLNAAISLAQGTQISAGIGANISFSVGQVLHPVNEVVESFSHLMLLASVAFGIQKVLLLIGQDMLVKCLLSATLFAWGALRVIGGKRNRWLDAALVLMLMVRFAIPVVTMATDAVFERFLHAGYTRSTEALATTTDTMNRSTEDFRGAQPDDAADPAAPVPATPAAASTTAQAPTGLAERMYKAMRELGAKVEETGDSLGAAVAGLDPRAYLKELKDSASAAMDHIIELMVVFLLQTLLVPVFLLWAMYAVLRGVVANAFAA